MSPSTPTMQLLQPSLEPWTPTRPPCRQIAVLMSGGVDSALTTHLLREQGWDVLGVTMKIPTCSTGQRGCCGAEAALVCSDLGVCHYFVDVAEAFQHHIIEPFRRAYAAGRTPNPCVDCNTELKFTRLWDLLREKFGIRRLATGHYARIEHAAGGHVRLARARDAAKDQSYFLYGIPRDRLGDLVLPLGDLTKSEVRALAARQRLRVADKPESMELCFAGEADYRNALRIEGHRPGDIVDMKGRRIGVHRGIAHYTLGQRRGLDVAAGAPLYVARLDARTNTLVAGTRAEVSTRRVRAQRPNILIPEDFSAGSRLFGRIRSGGQPQPCALAATAADSMTVLFDEPQFAPCPGQRLVLYDRSGQIVAGGTIAPLL